MKKFLSVLLCVFMIAACIPFSVAAEDVHRGHEITLTVTIDDQADIKAGSIELVFDESVFEMVSGEWTLATEPFAKDAKNGRGVFAYAAPTTVGGDIFTAKFNVKDGAKFGASAITATVQLTNSAKEKIVIDVTLGEYDVVCKHSFTEKIVDEDHLASGATCTEAAKYYFTCEICGVKGTTTFEQGDKLPHVYDKEVATKDHLKAGATCDGPAVYYKSCKCGANGTETFVSGDKLAHVYDNKCDASCNLCGATRETEHTYGESYKSDADRHWYECTSCGHKKTINAHDYDNGCDTSCNTCGYERTTAHVSDKLDKDDAKHWNVCKECGAKYNEAAHVFDNACDTECNTCGQKREIKHTYGEKYSTDEANHWYECTVCKEKKDVAAHTYDNACDTDCNDCGLTRETAHVAGEAFEKDETNHWNTCTVCGEKMNEAAHVFDGTCDADCNVCKETRVVTHTYGEEYKKDETNHWYECACGDKKDVAAHIFDNACDTDCNTCGQTRTAAEHKWDEGKVTKEPTQSEKGEVTFTCTECGKTKTEETPMLPSGGCGGGTDEGTLVAVISSGTILLVWFVFKKKIFKA